MSEQFGTGTTKKKVSFQVDNLNLEGRLHSFDCVGLTPAVIVCHPHPLYGGTMHSAIVVEVCEELNRKGIIALRFNFRGVEASQGEYGEGLDEVKDVRAAVSFVSSLPNVDPSRVGLVGYSFGAMVSLSAAVSDDRIRAVAAISLPIAVYDFDFFKNYAKPKMFIVGENDEFSPSPALAKFVEGLPDPKRIEVVATADHFWIGFQRLVAVKVTHFLAEFLSPEERPCR